MIHLRENEKIELKTRRHWFVLFRSTLALTIIYLIPFGLFYYLGNLPEGSVPFVLDLSGGVALFAGALWSLLIWLKLFAIWTDYYLDVWVMTDRRVVNIDQRSFFDREVSTLRMERIQDVTFEVRGIIATLLKFGNIHVQTAGESVEFIFKDIPNPEYIKGQLLEHVDSITERPEVGARQVVA